jgi:hypothetical protein
LNLFKYIILSPDDAANEVALNLVKDRGGFELERNALGVMVASPKLVARDLNLIPLVDANVDCLEPAIA